MKKFLLVCLALCVVSGVAHAGGTWVFKDVVICGRDIATDEGMAKVNLEGFKNPYAVTVAGDGKIWAATYYSRKIYPPYGDTLPEAYYPDYWEYYVQVSPDTVDTIEVWNKPLWIYDPADGSVDTVRFLNFADGSIDTLEGSARGLLTDHEGNIIYANNEYALWKINYQTHEAIAKYEFDFSPARPAVDAAGYVYFTGLFGGDLFILDPDDWSAPYNSISGIAPSVCRTIAVSPDGKDIYVAAYTGGVQHYYSADGVDGAYAIVDTIFAEHNGTPVEGNLVQWDPAGLLWVGTREEATLKIMWALDPAQDYAIVDSTSFTWWGNTDMTDTTFGNYAQPQYLRCPRDAAFSADGKTMYIADMYGYTIKAYEHVAGTVSGVVGLADNPADSSGTLVTINGYSDSTDAHGYYEITGVLVGTYDVTVTHDGYVTVVDPNVVISTDITLNYTLDKIYTLSGVVGLSDNPADSSGSLVTVTGGFSDSTDAHGYYEITGLLAGTYNIIVTHEGYNTIISSGVVISSDTTIDYTLVPVVGIEEIPTVYSLSQNRPNPFSTGTTIEYAIPKAGNVEMVVYNAAGQKVRTLIDAMQGAGYYKMKWDGTNDNGERLGGGTYFYKITAGEFTSIKKLILLR